MAGLPVVSGDVQVTSNAEAGEPEDLVTDGASGLAGGSFTSVTLTVRDRVSV